MMRQLASVSSRVAEATTTVAPKAPARVTESLANVDNSLQTAVAALNREDINYWEFRDATGRVEAHSYYQYPAMMVPSMQRILLQTVLRLQPGIRTLVDPFAGIVKLRLTTVLDAQHGGFATGWPPASWGSIDELFVNLTMPSPSWPVG